MKKQSIASAQYEKYFYGRLLRYVYLPDGTLFNLKMIEDGFAYTRFPFKLMEQFRQAERDTRENARDLWSDVGFKSIGK